MNKRLLTVLCVLVLVLLPLVVSAGMYGVYRGYPVANVYVDGKQVTSDVPAFVIDGRTMVPLRFVSDALGAGVAWDGSTQSARITKIKLAVATEKELYYALKSAMAVVTVSQKYLTDTALTTTRDNKLKILLGIYIMESCQKMLTQPIQDDLHSLRMDALHWMEFWVRMAWSKHDIWRANEEGRYQDSLKIIEEIKKARSAHEQNVTSLAWLDENIHRLNQQYGTPSFGDPDAEAQPFLDWVNRNIERIGEL